MALSRQPSAVASPTLVAALVPVTRDTAQLVLTWGEVRATAAIQYQEVQLPPRPAASGRQIPPVNRKHDDENVGARATMLSQLNEAALVDPQGARVSVTFARTFPKGTSSQSAAGTTRRAGLVVEGPDFGRLMSTRDGAVVELTEAPALRLSIDRAVRAGNMVLRPGNQTPGVAGAYSLWLKRAGAGWRLVFNQEPDVWGSQRDPKSDVGEVDLTYSDGGEPSRPLGVALQPIADRSLAAGPRLGTARVGRRLRGGSSVQRARGVRRRRSVGECPSSKLNRALRIRFRCDQAGGRPHRCHCCACSGRRMADGTAADISSRAGPSLGPAMSAAIRTRSRLPIPILSLTSNTGHCSTA